MTQDAQTAAIGAEAMREALEAAYKKVEMFPEERGEPMTVGGAGFMDLLALRNLIPQVIAHFSQPVAAPQAEMADDKYRKVLEAIKEEGMRNHNTRCRDWWPAVVAALQP